MHGSSSEGRVGGMWWISREIAVVGEAWRLPQRFAFLGISAQEV